MQSYRSERADKRQFAVRNRGTPALRTSIVSAGD